MGKYEELKEFPEKQFRKLTGVQRETFEKMVAILLEATSSLESIIMN